MSQATGEFTVDSWDENTYQDLGDGAKLTRAEVTQTFSGALAGAGSVQWLMCYAPDGTAHFVGLQRVEGTLDGREGAFVAETVGDFGGTVAKWTLTVLPGSATGGLAGLTATGHFEAPHGSKATFDLEYEFS